MTLDRCIKATADELGISEADAREIADRLAVHAKRLQAEGNLGRVEPELRKFAKSEAEKARIAAALKQKHAALNIIVRDNFHTDVRAMMAEGMGPVEAVMARLVGSYMGIDKARKSVNALRLALEGDWLGGVLKDIRRELPHVVRLLERPKEGKPLFDDVVREMWELKPGGTPGKTGNADAQKLAAIFAKYGEASRLELNRLGANIGKLDGWAGPQSHDEGKLLKAGAKAWVDDISKRLDLERSFGEGTTLERAREILDEVYLDIVTGRDRTVSPAQEGQRLGPANLARSLEKHRVLHFASPDDWIAYSERFSRGNVLTGMLDHLNSAARKASLMQVLGPNPETMLTTILADMQQRIRRGASPNPEKAAKEIAALRMGAGLGGTRIGKAYAEVSGNARIPTNVSAARWSANIRAAISWAKLGGAVISSITDLATYAHAMRFQGKSILGSYSDALSALFTGGPGGKDTALLLGAGMDSIMGDIIAHYDANDALQGSMARGTSTFFKLSGLTWWTERLEGAFANMTSVYMAQRAAVPFEQLDEAYRHVLGLHGIDAARWELVRKLPRAEGDYRFVFPEEVQGLDDDLFDPLVADRLSMAEGAFISRAAELRRRDLEEKGWVERRVEKFQARFDRSRARLEAIRDKMGAGAEDRVAGLQDRIDAIEGRLDEIAEFHGSISGAIADARRIGRREARIEGMQKGLQGRLKAIGQETAAALDRRDAGAGKRFREVWAQREADLEKLLADAGKTDPEELTKAIDAFRDDLGKATAAHEAGTLEIATKGDERASKVDAKINTLAAELGELGKAYREIRGGIGQARAAGRDEGRLKKTISALEADIRRANSEVQKRSSDLGKGYLKAWQAWEEDLLAFMERSKGRQEARAEELKALPARFEERTARIREQAKRELELDLRSFFADEATFAVLKGDDRSRAMMTQGTAPGTPVGEAIRFMGQFKSFPFTYIQKVLGRSMKSGPGGKRDYAAVATLIAMSTLLGYVAMTAKDALKNRTMKDPTSLKTWMAAMVQGGGAGIYGDYLFGEYNRFGGGMAADFAGPAFGTGFNFIENLQKMKSGDVKAGDWLYFGINNTPYINLWWTRWALDLAILNQLQEWASPGTLRRREQRLGKDFGQEYITEPNPIWGP